MEILSSCRICLVRGVRMHMIFNTYLQEIFEQLTNLPFQREDGRPLFICYICKARLKNCHETRLNCLQSKEYFGELLNNQIKSMPLQYVNTLQIVHPIICCSYVPVATKESENDVVLYDDDLKTDPLEICDVKVKWENSEGDLINEKLKLPAIKENQSTTSNNPQTEVRFAPNKNVKNIHPVKKPSQGINKDICRNTSAIATEIMDTSGDLLTSSLLGDLRIYAKTYWCDTCKKGFNHKQSLIRHTRVHTEEKSYRCDLCYKRFSNKEHLVRHTPIHAGKKPYRCDICDKRFSQKGDLVRHTRIHTGEKPYMCDICDKRFNQNTYLVQHMRIHTGEKPYKCDVCDKRFSEKGQLVRHIRIHTGEKPYRCDICHKRFSQKTYLVRHTRIHTGEKPYRCDICEKGFLTKHELTVHTRLHTGEKPYRCEMCDKNFSDRSNFGAHTRIHTGNMKMAV